MNLRTIVHLSRRFECPAGLSDHTLGTAVPITAVALGGCIIEKHLALRRADGGPDSHFSLEPDEFKKMVDDIRTAEKSLGIPTFDLTDSQRPSSQFRRSLFVAMPVAAGETFTMENIRSVRPGDGLSPKYLGAILGRLAACDLQTGTPLCWEHLADEETAPCR
jgi:sialic acid synthase SpsE